MPRVLFDNVTALGVVLPERSYCLPIIVCIRARPGNCDVDNFGNRHVCAVARGLEALKFMERPIECALEPSLLTAQLEHSIAAIPTKRISQAFLVVEQRRLHLDQAPESPSGRNDLVSQHQLELTDGGKFGTEALAESNQLGLGFPIDDTHLGVNSVPHGIETGGSLALRRPRACRALRVQFARHAATVGHGRILPLLDRGCRTRDYRTMTPHDQPASRASPLRSITVNGAGPAAGMKYTRTFLPFDHR